MERKPGKFVPRGLIFVGACMFLTLLIAGDTLAQNKRVKTAAETSVTNRDGGWDKAGLKRKLAYTLYQSGKLDEAAKVYEELLQEGIADRESILSYTWVLNEQKKYDEAWKVISRLPWPNRDYKKLKIQAYTAWWAKKYQPAEVLFKELTRRMPNKDEFRYTYALILKELGRYPQSLDQFSQIGTPARLGKQYQTEYARLLLTADKARKSLEKAEGGLENDPENPDLLLLAARAAEKAGEPAKAADYLVRLAKVTKLNASQLAWMAGLRRSTDNRRGALQAYEEVARLYPEYQTAMVLEAIGDLRWEVDRFDQCLDAYLALTQFNEKMGKPISTGLHLKLARAAAKVDKNELADEHYLSLVEMRPENHALILEAARHFAKTDSPEIAAALFEKYTSLKPEPTVWLETATVLLAAKDYEGAEKWAKIAYEAENQPPTAPYIYAQALHYQEKSEEADPILTNYIEAHPDDAQALALGGMIATTLDRNYQAYGLFDRAIANGAPLASELEVWKAICADKRNDYKSAYISLDHAIEMGTDQELAERVEKSLEKKTRASLELPGAYSEDSNDLNLWRVGAEGYIYLQDYRPLGLRYFHGEVKQDEVSFDRNSLQGFMPRFYLNPSWQLEWNLGIDWLGNTDTEPEDEMVLGSADLRYNFEDKSYVGLYGGYGSFWSNLDSSDPQRYHRIIELGGLAPTFDITSMEAYFLKDFATRNYHWQVNLGHDWYDDDNNRSWLYSHFLIPVVDEVGNWLAVKPNIFTEFFSDKQPAYFSPDEHYTIGVMLHYIKELDESYFFEIELNPQLQNTEDNWGWGAHGLLEFKLNLDPLYPGIGLFGFYDHDEDYWLLRGIITLQVRF